MKDKFNRLKKMHKRFKYEDQAGGRKFTYAKYFDQLEAMDENFRKEVGLAQINNNDNNNSNKHNSNNNNNNDNNNNNNPKNFRC